MSKESVVFGWIINKANIFLGLIEYELNSLLDSTLKDIC